MSIILGDTEEHEVEFYAHNIDTLIVAYYLKPQNEDFLDSYLKPKKEALLNNSKLRVMPIEMGGIPFLLHKTGGGSGYTYLFTNNEFSIQYGPKANPSFYVDFASHPLWAVGARELHSSFLQWALNLNYYAIQPETISRLDPAFDFFNRFMNFSKQYFISRFRDCREYGGKNDIDTIYLGGGDLLLRLYDKVEEMSIRPHKQWIRHFWKSSIFVWRIEWQIRNRILKEFALRTIDDLENKLGDVLMYLADEHTILLESPIEENKPKPNRHPLWIELVNAIKSLPKSGITRNYDNAVCLEASRLQRIKMLHSFLVGYSALDCMVEKKKSMTRKQSMKMLLSDMKEIYDNETWKASQKKKIILYKNGKWK